MGATIESGKRDAAAFFDVVSGRERKDKAVNAPFGRSLWRTHGLSKIAASVLTIGYNLNTFYGAVESD